MFVTVVFVDGYYFEAKSAVVKQEEFLRAALTLGEDECRDDSDTDETIAGITAAVAELFALPKHTVTVIGHAWKENCRELLCGSASIRPHLEDALVVRALTDRAECTLPAEVFTRVPCEVCPPHHTVVFVQGDK